MGSLLKSTRNTRCLIKGSLRFLRSDVPDRLTDQEIQWLKENQVTTIIDLREEQERREKTCPLLGDKAFQYLCLPVTGGNAVPKSAEEVSRSYTQMADGQMERIIETILTASSNVLYFCNAGKDRTGVVSAILLRRLGASREEIIADYVMSAENLREVLDEHIRRFPHVDISVITPQPKYMDGFLDWLCQQERWEK